MTMLKPFLIPGLALLGMFSIVGSTTAQTASLTARQKASLQSLGIPIVVPKDVPAGYVVSKVNVKPCPTNAPREKKGICRFGPDYSIVYRNAAKNSCFAIGGTGGGVGGVGFEYEVPVETPLFGQVSLQFGEQNGDLKSPTKQQLASPQKNLFMDWSGTGPFYHLVGADFVRGEYYGEQNNKPVSQCRNNITPNEAIRTIRSLTWLK